MRQRMDGTATTRKSETAASSIVASEIYRNYTDKRDRCFEHRT